jgi:4-amino-4-deoxy-L-arabinose transferase
LFSVVYHYCLPAVSRELVERSNRCLLPVAFIEPHVHCATILIMPLQYKKYWLIVIAITLILAFAFQGTRGLWEPDEGRYVRCAYEMVQSGDWLTPRLNGSPHFTKPPLTYWLIATGLTLFGLNEWAARFFHAIAFVVTALMAGYLASHMWDKKTGLLSALIYVTMVLPFISANIATTDMILTCFETGAMLCFWMGAAKQQDAALRTLLWALLMGLFLGLAFITKGPPGLFPLLVGAVYLALSLRVKRPSYPVMTLGFLVFMSVALPWYLLVIQKNNGLLAYFLKDEFFGRIVTGVHGRNSGPLGAFKIYPASLFFGALPWSWLWCIWGWNNRAGIVTLRWWKQLRQHDNALFIAVWFLLPLFLLTIANSRLPLYVLPLFVPLALASARALLRYYPAQAAALSIMRGKPFVYVLLLFFSLICSRAIAAYQTPQRDSRYLWQQLRTAIHERAGDGHYELSTIGLSHEALAFYSRRAVDRIQVREEHSHAFIPKKGIEQKCDEMLNNNALQVFLVSRRDVKRATAAFDKRGIHHVIEQGPFDYALFFCQKAGAQNSMVTRAAQQKSGAASIPPMAVPGL